MKMTDKAYIVANEQQEMAVLRELEGQGCKWLDGFDKPTEFIPSVEFGGDVVEFPYVIFEYGYSNLVSISYIDYDNLENFGFSNVEIVFDGRKEEKMSILSDEEFKEIQQKASENHKEHIHEMLSKTYNVSQDFINNLREWRNACISTEDYERPAFVDALSKLPSSVTQWWYDNEYAEECNFKLVALMRWLSADSVFEVEKPKKWVVRSLETDDDDDFAYFEVIDNFVFTATYDKDKATRFDTKEEAQEWCNSHQEPIKVEE